MTTSRPTTIHTVTHFACQYCNSGRATRTDGRTDGRIIAGRRGQGGRGFISQVNTRMDKADIDGDMYAYVMDLN